MCLTVSDSEYCRKDDERRALSVKLKRPNHNHYSPNTGFALVHRESNKDLASYFGSKANLQAWIDLDHWFADLEGIARTEWRIVKLDPSVRIYPHFAAYSNTYELRYV